MVYMRRRLEIEDMGKVNIRVIQKEKRQCPLSPWTPEFYKVRSLEGN